MTPSRKPSAPKPIKAWAIVSPPNGDKGIHAVGRNRKDAWQQFAAQGDRCPDGYDGCEYDDEIACLKGQGYRCIRVTITPA